MLSLIKSKIKSLFNDFVKEIPTIVIIIISFVYSINSKEYLLLGISSILLIHLFLKNKQVFYCLLVILIVILIRMIIKEIIYSSYVYEDISKLMYVTKVENYDTYQKIYLRCGIYNYIAVNSKFNFVQSGDFIKIKGVVEKQLLNQTNNGFNYYEYLKNLNIIGKINIKELTITKSTFNLNIIHESIRNYLYKEYTDPYGSIICCLTIGDKSFMDDSLINEISNLGISHLFVISGLHMEIISSFIFLILKKVKLKEEYKNIIVLSVLLIYYILTLYMVSILRVIISFIINKILSKQFINIIPYKKLLFNAGIVLILNPYYIFSYSFILSYAIVLGILILGNKLKKDKGFKSFIINNLLISLSSTIISIPIVSRMGSSINILSIVYNLFYIPYVSYILLPVSFIGLIKPLSIITKLFCDIFLKLSSFLNGIDIFNLSFSYPSLIIIILFYFIYLIILKTSNKRIKLYSLISMSLLILSWIFINNVPLNDSITFLSLKKGESTVITTSFNNTVTIIDTGEEDAGLVDYLTEVGIRKVDYLILTHSDSDHVGDLDNLIENVKVKKILVNYYDSYLIKTCSKYRNKISIKKIKCGDQIKYDNIKIKVFNPSEDSSTLNNNSLCFILNINSFNILFTGDIEVETEEKLTTELSKYKIDIIKVSHHGSKTSSSYDYIKEIKPKIAIAMNGYNNGYGFPSIQTINTFRSLHIPMYNTNDYGTIYVEFKNKKYYLTNSYGIKFT